MAKLHSIAGTKPPDTPKQRVADRMKQNKPMPLIECPRCAGHEVIETKVGVMMKSGKPTGGTKQLICATCAIKGERVVVG